MTVVFVELLEKDDLEVNFIKSLNQTFFVIIDLGERIFVETDLCLLMINWGQDQMEVRLEGSMLRKCEIDVV